MFYAMARKPNAKILKSSALLPCVNCFTSIFASLTTFCFIGHVATKKGIPVDQVMDSTLDLAFIAYPSMMTTLTMPNFWSILFFGMLVMVGIDTVFGWYNYVIAFCFDFWPSLRTKVSKQTFVFCVVAFYFTCGLLFVT
mmetsp:Transcript_24363/g.37739  ORF Transcript_24363/g.37739 Transcript_24363/m.37739 type:complete len:139 (-) Transcript_24363:535-951(-)